MQMIDLLTEIDFDPSKIAQLKTTLAKYLKGETKIV